mgnify:CR=1 FL=1
MLWFTAEGTGHTPQNTSKIALIDTQPELWAQLTLLATMMKNGLGMSTVDESAIAVAVDSMIFEYDCKSRCLSIWSVLEALTSRLIC